MRCNYSYLIDNLILVDISALQLQYKSNEKGIEAVMNAVPSMALILRALP